MHCFAQGGAIDESIPCTVPAVCSLFMMGGVLIVMTLASTHNVSSAQNVFSFAFALTDTQPMICNFSVKANFSEGENDSA